MCSLGWCYVILHQMVKALALALTASLPLAPLLNQISIFFYATSNGPHSMSNYLVFCLLMFSFSSVDRLALTV